MRRVGSLPLFVLLCLLFVFAQQAAVLHALSHDSEAPTQQDKHLPGAKVCEKCVVFAQFSAAAASSNTQLDLSAALEDFVSYADKSVRQQSAVAYLSRAPPIFS
jgi:hypothetical protein